MFRNYLKTAWRSLWKQKVYSLINVLGLTIGFICCLFIALYVQHEVSYENFQTNRHRIARVIMGYSFDGGSTEETKGNFTSIRVAPIFKSTFPEVESSIRMRSLERVINNGGQPILQEKFLYADSTFFNIFSFPLLQGDPHTALAGPNKVVLSTTAAQRYFGKENPIGKTLQLMESNTHYLVTGVTADCPSNSQIKYEVVASFSSLAIPAEHADTYWDANYTTYVLLNNESSFASLQPKIDAFMKKEMEGKGASVDLMLEPFTSVHLHSPYEGFEPNSSIVYIYILLAVALLILMIACFTYINLSTARSMERAREVGVRKVIGAGRGQLFWQFIGESFLLCLLAVVLSYLLTVLLLPAFNTLTGKELPASPLFSLPFISATILTAFVVSLVAGSYPALVIAGFKPVKVLKGSFKNTDSGQWLRKSLIVFQFGISVFLIVCTFIVQKQLSYIQHKKLGYDKEHMLVLYVGSKSMDKVPALRQELAANPDIISTSRCDRVPIEGGGGYAMRSLEMPEDKQLTVTANPVDEDYIKTAGLELIAGSDLTSQDIINVDTDTIGEKEYRFIINESAARQLGWKPAEAVNKKLFMDASRPGIVKGVVKDFHFESLRNPIRPFILLPENRYRSLLVKLNGKNIPQTIAFIEKKWKGIIPNRPFEYHFMDADYDKMYNAEMRLGMIMKLFALIAIALACLGLFGLSSYSVKQRIKEIGIRKVLGASVSSIVIVLTKDFLGLTFIAIITAIPIAWWASTQWLKDFSYRTSVNWNIYVLAGIITLMLVIVTAGFQAIRAATANPVKSLKTE